MIKKILLIFIAWRIFLFLPLVASHFFLPDRKGYEYTLLTYFTPTENPIEHPLLAPWGNFDGVYYLLIAAKGYTINAGFFPLWPLMIKIVTIPFGNLLPFDPIQYISALLLVSALFFAALLVLYQLIRLDFSKNIALGTIIALLAFPTSFFYASIYTESLFLFLLVLSFYFARRQWWILAGITGAFLSVTRLVGIAIFPALLLEYVLCWPKESNKKRFTGGALLLVPLGLVSYIWYNAYRFGDPLFFIKAQGAFKNNRSVNAIIFPLQTVFRYLKILVTVSPHIYEWWVALFEFVCVLATAMLLYVGWKRGIRKSYLLFTLLAILLPASSGTFSGIPRYVVVLFPLFLSLAILPDRRLQKIYVIAGTILLFLFFMLFSKGYFIA